MRWEVIKIVSVSLGRLVLAVSMIKSIASPGIFITWHPNSVWPCIGCETNNNYYRIWWRTVLIGSFWWKKKAHTLANAFSRRTFERNYFGIVYAKHFRQTLLAHTNAFVVWCAFFGIGLSSILCCVWLRYDQWMGYTHTHTHTDKFMVWHDVDRTKAVNTNNKHAAPHSARVAKMVANNNADEMYIIPYGRWRTAQKSDFSSNGTHCYHIVITCALSTRNKTSNFVVGHWVCCRCCCSVANFPHFSCSAAHIHGLRCYDCGGKDETMD